MKLFLLSFFITISALVQAQAIAGRQVIGCMGQQLSPGPGIAVSYTVGESIAGKVGNVNYTVTQGFQQGKNIGVITLAIETGPASCPTSTDGFARVVSIVGCDPPYTITWSNGVVGEENLRLGPGNHMVTVTTFNCIGEYSFAINSGPVADCTIRFFNAFSPNGDGKNDTWNIENVYLQEYENNTIEIYNRWGQLVWDGTNYDNQSVVWDGTSKNGSRLPAATYYFIADFNGEIHKGFIELTR